MIALSYPFDPILQYRPPFARSVPVQILFTGIVFTLAAVLLIHLLFTAQYHWPLAPVNFTLQVSAVTTLVVSCVATIHVIMSTVSAQSREWPYMLDYIAVNIPPLTPEPNQFINGNWTTAGLAAWLLMNATVGMLIQVRSPLLGPVATYLSPQNTTAHTYSVPDAPVSLHSRAPAHLCLAWPTRRHVRIDAHRAHSE